MATRESGQRKEYHFKLFKTPKETIVALSVAATKKSEMRLDTLIVLAFLSGVWIALGGLVSLIASGGMPGSDPGPRKIVAGVTFSCGLMIVVAAGAELFTGNIMFYTVGLLTRKVSFFATLRNWLVVWTFNFFGSLSVAYLLAYLTELLLPSPYLGYVQGLTAAKINVGWGIQLLRGIGANILVCLATLASVASEDIGSKLFAILFFISAFVIIGFEHSVANMFTLPVGLMYGANSTIGAMMWQNIAPVTLGNMIGGFFVGFFYFWAYIQSATLAAKRTHSMWQRFLKGEGLAEEPTDPWTKSEVPLQKLS